MKRAVLIAFACAAVAGGAAAAGRDYSYLDPPTLAVADFEVSMSADKEGTKQFYGQLISQAILSVLVQQNSASMVYAPMDGRVLPGTSVYEPGTTGANSRPSASESAAARDFANAVDKAKADYLGAKDESARLNALEAAEKAAARLAAYWTGHEEIVMAKKGQLARLYFPSIFKIFDKKYVENALQNGSFTVKELYTKAAGAFNFADLDFLVLGNVYETRQRGAGGSGSYDAIGFNVRVLNTRRAEELYSYSAVVDRYLGDLPLACAQVCQRIMVDLLNSHCAQVTITESAEVSNFGKTSTGADPEQDSSGVALAPYDYRLFWQPRQVERDDNTVGDSDDSNKRPVQKNVFYWTLPGQYIVSVYNKDSHQLSEIPFTIGAGDIRNVVIERRHLDAPRGSILISGISPVTFYTFDGTLKKQHEQYWWEIFDSSESKGSFSVSIENGERKKDMDSKETVTAEYRYATQDLLISNVPLGTYDIVATLQPSDGLSSITGLWYTSTRLVQISKPLSVSLRDPKDAKLQIADFGLQEKQKIDSPKSTKVTFILKPGFGYSGYVLVDDGSPTYERLRWFDKEKITLSSEYSQADWEAYPMVTYTVWVPGYSAKDPKYFAWKSYSRTFMKSQIAPEKDIIVLVDLAELRSNARKEADLRADMGAKEEAERAALAAKAEPAAQVQAKASQAGSPDAAKSANTAPAGSAPKFYLNLGAGVGYGNYTYDVYYGNYMSGPAITLGAQFYWHFAPFVGIGLGGLFNTIPGSSATGGAATANFMFGDTTKGKAAFTIDIGGGSGFTAGAGMVFLKPGRKGGLSTGIDYFLSYYYPESAWSLTFNVGYMFGF